MASIWVKVVGGGLLAAAVGSAIGESVPAEPPKEPAAHPEAVEASEPQPMPVLLPKPADQPKAEDYPMVRQANSMSAKGNGISLLLNLDGELCAEVISSRYLKGDSFEIVCQESRIGSATARYRFNAVSGKSVRLS